MPFDDIADVLTPSLKDGEASFVDSPFGIKPENKKPAEKSRDTDKSKESEDKAKKDKTEEAKAKEEPSKVDIERQDLVRQALAFFAISHVGVQLIQGDPAAQRPAQPNIDLIKQQVEKEIPHAPAALKAAYVEMLSRPVGAAVNEETLATRAKVHAYRQFKGDDPLSTSKNPEIRLIGQQLSGLGRQLAEVENLLQAGIKPSVIPKTDLGQQIVDAEGIRPDLLHAKIIALRNTLLVPDQTKQVLVRQQNHIVIDKNAFSRLENAVISRNPQYTLADRARHTKAFDAARQVRENIDAASPFKTNEPLSTMANNLWQARILLNKNNPQAAEQAKALLDPSKATNAPFADWFKSIRGKDGTGPIDRATLETKIAVLQDMYNPATHGGQAVRLTDAVNTHFLELAEKRYLAGNGKSPALSINEEACYRGVLAYMHTQDARTFDNMQGQTLSEKRQTAITYIANGLAAKMPYETKYKGQAADPDEVAKLVKENTFNGVPQQVAPQPAAAAVIERVQPGQPAPPEVAPVAPQDKAPEQAPSAPPEPVLNGNQPTILTYLDFIKSSSAQEVTQHTMQEQFALLLTGLIPDPSTAAGVRQADQGTTAAVPAAAPTLQPDTIEQVLAFNQTGGSTAVPQLAFQQSGDTVSPGFARTNFTGTGQALDASQQPGLPLANPLGQGVLNGSPNVAALSVIRNQLRSQYGAQGDQIFIDLLLSGRLNNTGLGANGGLGSGGGLGTGGGLGYGSGLGYGNTGFGAGNGMNPMMQMLLMRQMLSGNNGGLNNPLNSMAAMSMMNGGMNGGGGMNPMMQMLLMRQMMSGNGGGLQNNQLMNSMMAMSMLNGGMGGGGGYGGGNGYGGGMGGGGFGGGGMGGGMMNPMMMMMMMPLLLSELSSNNGSSSTGSTTAAAGKATKATSAEGVSQKSTTATTANGATLNRSTTTAGHVTAGKKVEGGGAVHKPVVKPTPTPAPVNGGHKVDHNKNGGGKVVVPPVNGGRNGNGGRNNGNGGRKGPVNGGGGKHRASLDRPRSETNLASRYPRGDEDSDENDNSSKASRGGGVLSHFSSGPETGNGFLLGMRGGGFGVNGMNPWGTKNRDKDDDDDDDDDQKRNAFLA